MPNAKKTSPHLMASQGLSMCLLGRQLHRLAATVLTAFCISISTSAWAADTKSLDFSGFDGVSAAEGVHVIVTTGESYSVIAESDEPKQLELLTLEIVRTTLRVGMEDNVFLFSRSKGWKVTVRVTMPELTLAEASSGAELLADSMRGSVLELTSSSGSEVRIEAIEGETLTTAVSSGASLRVEEGACKSLTANVSSGSTLGMKDLQCAKVEVDASSGADVSVFASDSIVANASSGASIRVYGSHEDIAIQTSSGGEIVFP